MFVKSFLQKKTTLILKPLSDGWENMGAGPCMWEYSLSYGYIGVQGVQAAASARLGGVLGGFCSENTGAKLRAFGLEDTVPLTSPQYYVFSNL